MTHLRRPFCVQDLPSQVLDAVETAAERCDDLAAAGLEVAFRCTSRGVRAELRTTQGDLIRVLAPSEALAFAAV